jgi:dihydrofolate reductase
MTRYVYIAVSLDGYIAGRNDALDWLEKLPNPTQSDFGWAAFMTGIDAVVIGRRTWETVMNAPVWPYEKPVFVLSTTLKDLPEELRGKAELANESPRDLVARLAKRGFHDLYIDGGRTIQGFLREDLIDELIITWVSVVLGDGIPLFGSLEKQLDLKLKTSEVLNEYLVKSYYTRR